MLCQLQQKQQKNMRRIQRCFAAGRKRGLRLVLKIWKIQRFFDDLVDSGLLNLDGVLTIEQILGATLTKTCDSLTPLTPDVVAGIKEVEQEIAVEEAAETEAEQKEEVASSQSIVTTAGGVLKIHIGKGKDIDIEIPTGITAGAAGVQMPALQPASVVPVAATPAAEEKPEKVIRSLTRKHFKNYRSKTWTGDEDRGNCFIYSRRD